MAGVELAGLERVLSEEGRLEPVERELLERSAAELAALDRFLSVRCYRRRPDRYDWMRAHAHVEKALGAVRLLVERGAPIDKA